MNIKLIKFLQKLWLPKKLDNQKTILSISSISVRVIKDHTQRNYFFNNYMTDYI